MAEESPLGCAEKGMGLHIRGASAGTDTAKFVFDEKFSDKGLAEAVGRD